MTLKITFYTKYYAHFMREHITYSSTFTRIFWIFYGIKFKETNRCIPNYYINNECFR